MLVASARDLGAARRSARATETATAPSRSSRPGISALAEKIRTGVMEWVSSTQDSIPCIVSEIYRDMERLTGEMLALGGKSTAQQSDRALQELALAVAIQNLASYTSNEGEALELAAADLVERCSRKVTEVVQ